MDIMLDKWYSFLHVLPRNDVDDTALPPVEAQSEWFVIRLAGRGSDKA